MTAPPASAGPSAGFQHEALLYRDDESLLAGVLPFVRDGLAAGEQVVLALPPPHLDLLRGAVGGDVARVRWVGMAEVGANPARLLGVLTAALADATAGGRRLRVVGEPAWPGRREAEYSECRLHELLLGTAFDGGPPWRLLCPYDQTHLPRAVRRAALQSHPVVSTPERRRPSPAYSREAAAEAFAAPLHQPTEGVLRGGFGAGDLRATRRTVASFARSCGLAEDRVRVLELAAAELVANSLRHGGGSGSLALWETPDAVVVEVGDAGQVRDPLAGRRTPPPGAPRGQGLHVVNQLCDLVQLRSSPRGTTVRITTWR
ncbi:anti-sigma factor RsbA family regulatory protein [Blastococcus sp. SYSU D01042]